MRLPWPFGRSASPGGPDTGHAEGPDAGVAPPAAAPVPAGPSATPLGPATGAWATLPPIQRTTGEVPVVAPAGPFLAAVPGHRPLPPIVGALGHDVAPAAPAGLVLAHVTAVPSLTASTPMPTRPLQRRATAGDTASTWFPGDDAGASAEPDPEPIRRLPAVEPAATAVPEARPLTRAPDLAPAVAQRSTASAMSPASAPGPSPVAPAVVSSAAGPSAPASLPLHAPAPARTASRWSEAPTPGASRPVGLGAPLPAAAAPGAGPSTAPTAPSPVAPAIPAIPDAPGPSPAGRPVGLGAPLAAVPPTAAPLSLVAQRRASAGTGGEPAEPGAPVSSGTSAPTPHAPSPAGHGAAPALPAAAGASRPLPVLPVARSRSSTGPTPTSALVAPAPGAAPLHHAPGQRPLAGSRPLQPSFTAQREPASATPAGAGAGDGGSVPGPAPVAARWSSGDDLPSTVIALPPAASRAPDEAPALLRPLDAAPPEPDASAMTVPVGMREIVFPTRGSSSPSGGPAAVQRLGAPDLGTGVPGFAALPGFATPAGVRGQEGRQDGEHAVGLPRHAPGPAFRSGSGSPSMPVVSRSAPSTAGRSVVAVPPVQRSPAPAAAPASAVAAPAITTVVQRVDGAAASPTAAATGEGHSDTELDELARALFGRFRTQLRADVIHEREARGLTFDAF